MKNRRPLIITIGAVLVLVVLALVTASSRNPSLMENVVGTVLTPVQSFASSVSGGIIDFFKKVFSATDLDVENAELKARIVQLEEDTRRMSEIEKENERLRGMLDFQDENAVSSAVAARVIGKNPGVWFDVFLVGVGRNKGIEVGMPVINAQGVVGRVMEVGQNYSKVMSVMDSRIAIAAIVERTRDSGTVRGGFSITSDDGLLELYHLPFENDLAPGDLILTSGIGGGYPKGLLIGEVVEVSRVSEGVGRNALVKPAVDFLRLEEVSIITDLPEMPDVELE